MVPYMGGGGISISNPCIQVMLNGWAGVSSSEETMLTLMTLVSKGTRGVTHLCEPILSNGTPKVTHVRDGMLVSSASGISHLRDPILSKGAPKVTHVRDGILASPQGMCDRAWVA